jgi:flavodoxin I
MGKIAIFYGSSTGTTSDVAQAIQQKIGKQQTDIFDVANTPVEKVKEYQYLILGCSTWGIGDVQDDFDSFLRKLKQIELKDKKIALFGLGDQESYPDTFVDAMGIVYLTIKDQSCSFIGKVSTTGYSFSFSKAQEGEYFVGLALDENNQSSLTENRINDWVESLKSEFL